MLGAHSTQLFQLCSRELPCVGSPWGSCPTQHSPLLGSGTLCRETNLGKNGHALTLILTRQYFLAFLGLGWEGDVSPPQASAVFGLRDPWISQKKGDLQRSWGPEVVEGCYPSLLPLCRAPQESELEIKHLHCCIVNPFPCS